MIRSCVDGGLFKCAEPEVDRMEIEPGNSREKYQYSLGEPTSDSDGTKWRC